MNNCCNGSSDQKECCKAAVEVYKQKLAEGHRVEELLVIKEERSELVQQSWRRSIGLMALIVLTMIIIMSDAPEPWKIPLTLSVSAFFVSWFLLWKEYKKLKRLEKEIADEQE
jgi:hypothetical protein